MASVDTGNSDRDAHVLAPDMVDGQIRRQDFGLMPSVPAAMLGDVIKIELDLQLVEPASSDG